MRKRGKEREREDGRRAPLTLPPQATGRAGWCPGTGTSSDCAGEEGGRAPSAPSRPAGTPEGLRTLPRLGPPPSRLRRPGGPSPGCRSPRRKAASAPRTASARAGRDTARQGPIRTGQGGKQPIRVSHRFRKARIKHQNGIAFDHYQHFS